ncbi:putative quinol monooxygenase [Acaryochloris marina]|uniref:putative quinol monooxygenase n=1 Tax=Acaryochloris marina TaxID=155978 RepID=UPI0021C4749F|nr:putative quinol monooxygenase [Acaryochloris marina]BDM83309.1 antibiotic biosynthesis monooxygenase [Acaryochloris marina MBIC10699]
MNHSSLFVFARITPKPEYLSDARSAIFGIVSQTQSEPGCRQFSLLEGLDDGCLYLYEEWESQAALADHYQQPYTKSVFECYEQWLSQPVEVIKMRKPMANVYSAN